MPFDASGNFNRDFPPGGWQGDASADTKIRADRHDQHDSDLANGLSQCITKDGRTTIMADIPFNGKHITGLANPDPGRPQDAATKAYVDTIRTFATSLVITGADANGRLRFSSLTGANGIEWTAVDMSLLGRVGEANKTSHRLVINDKVDGTGNDVIVFDEGGRINATQYTYNLSWDGDEWRTIVPGYGTMMTLNGGLKIAGNDAATITDAYKAIVPPAPHEYFSVVSTGGSTILALDKSAKDVGGTGEHQADMRFTRGGLARWNLLMTAHDETGSNAGSNLYIQRYNDAGVVVDTPFYITRTNGMVTIPNLTVTTLTNTIIQNTSGTLYIAGTGGLVLYPNGYGGSNYYVLNAGGNWTCGGANNFWIDDYVRMKGITEHTGISGSYGVEQVNLNWSSTNGTIMNFYQDATLVGSTNFACDYRAKENIKPLDSKWDAIRRLKPVSFNWKNWDVPAHDDKAPERMTRISRGSPDEHWGFLAHELQEDLIPSAASGKKDIEGEVQQPNLMAIIAALTSALQEAMVRIEALEAK